MIQQTQPDRSAPAREVLSAALRQTVWNEFTYRLTGPTPGQPPPEPHTNLHQQCHVTTNLTAGELLAPLERIFNVLFEFSTVITFTRSRSVGAAEPDAVRTGIIGYIECSLAWEIIQAVFHLLSRTSEKNNVLKIWKAIVATPPRRLFAT